MPVTKENMNYVSVVSVGLTAAVLALYVFSKRGQYLGPRLPNELGQIVDGEELGNMELKDSGEKMSKKE